MDNILITGATGFLGSNFIKYNSDNYKNIFAITRGKPSRKKNIIYINLDLTNSNQVDKFIKNNFIDILLHFAFDHTYNNNEKMIKAISNAALKNKLNKYVLISSISVLQINNSKIGYGYNKKNDPYSFTKRKVEKIFLKMNEGLNNTKIIYPTIVYGEGGNWNKFINKCLDAKSFSLPMKGNVKCNYILVDDFSKKLHREIYTNTKKIIIGGTNGRWIDLYNLLNTNKKPLKIYQTKNLYHDNTTVNFILNLWQNTLLGFLANFLLSIYLKMKKRKNKPLSHKKISHISPVFSNRVIHSSNFEIS
mgnify:CR=1 FL=1